MNNLVKVENVNGILVTTSNRVAEELGVEHKSLLRKIDEYIEKFSSAQVCAQFYIPSEYRSKDGRTVRNYLITEKGVAQLIGGYSSAVPKAFDLNVDYINEFEKMKTFIKDNEIPKIPETIEDILIFNLQEQSKLKQRVEIIENKVDNEVRIDNGEQRKFQKCVGTRVYQRAEVVNIPKNLLFQALHRDIKDRFGVASYRDIKRKDLTTALDYISTWVEKAELREYVA